ncbi:MAG: LPS assembly protein LptD, partial [Candidatus Adiutrix sp.]|nr:LPS assembly protein LptD [Candidatus Adiutrix sp.]
ADDSIYIKKGTATTCDGPEPSWTIEATDITVTRGGYATASNVTINSKYFPFFYTPYFLFPVKNERQTGLLLPDATTSSRDGFTATLPFFWATGENHDLTITPIWRDKRGLAATLEGRYHFENGRGIWQGSYLNDHKPQTFSYRAGGSGRKTAKDRYWLRGMNNWEYGAWEFNLDLDLVSDPLYLSEFRDDIDGLLSTQRLFSQNFGRSFNEYLDPRRVSVFFAQTSDYDVFFRGGLEYADNLYSKNNIDTIQKLPSLYYALVSRPLPESLGFQGPGPRPRVSLDFNYDYFYRKTNNFSRADETGHRMHIKPSIAWNVPVGNIANLKLAGDMGVSFYAPDGRRLSAGGSLETARYKSWDYHLDGSLEASLSTTFSRIYDWGPGRDAVATRHQLTPTVSFTYVESPDQDDFPYWDVLDRRLPGRAVRYGLLNTFVVKHAVKGGDEAATGHAYFQFLKVGLWSSYEFADNSEWANKPGARYYSPTSYYDRGAGPMELEVEAAVNPYLSARILSALDGRTGVFTSHDVSLTLKDGRGDRLQLTYDFDAPQNSSGRKYEEVRANLGLSLTPEWRAGLTTRYDLHQQRSLETNATLSYQEQCYTVGLAYSKTRDDNRIGFFFDLLGLGGMNQ